MQDAGGVANTTGIHGHVDDLLLHLKRLADISIVQQKRAPTAESTLRAAVAFLAFSRRAVPDNNGSLAIRAIEHLSDHRVPPSCGMSSPDREGSRSTDLKHLPFPLSYTSMAGVGQPLSCPSLKAPPRYRWS